MARPDRRLPANVEGDFFVDDTCIDCDTCRFVAPDTFDELADQSRVHRQPRTPEEVRRAMMALVACPTASIGTTQRHDVRAATDAFPERIDGPVHYCGFAAESSFGASSYLVVRPEGNVLVDSPRFAAPLVKAIERLGGVRWMFLTHADDVADHARFRERFGCDRVLHEGDVGAGTASVEVVLRGTEPFALDRDLLAVPTPGHTKGSACLLVQDEYLFTGDHMALNPRTGRLYAFRSACWFDWSELVRSLDRLANLGRPFEWVLPGHGRRAHFPAAQMKEEMRRCVEWAKSR